MHLTPGAANRLPGISVQAVARRSAPRRVACILLPLVALAVLARGAAGQASLPPVTFDEVKRLVEHEVPASRIELIARERCFGFVWDSNAESWLRSMNASAETLEVVRRTCKRLPPPAFAGIPTMPPLEMGLIRPSTAVYQLRGEPDSVVHRFSYEARDGLRFLRHRVSRTGPDRSETSELVIDSATHAPVSYSLLAVAKSDTSRVSLRRLDQEVVGYARAFRRPTRFVRHSAHRGTLLPGISDVLLLSATRLEVGQQFLLSTFVPTTGASCLLTVSVERATQVRVPAGTFAAWQVRGSGCGPAFRVYVNKDPIADYPPRVILAMESSGDRMELISVQLQ